MEKLIITKKNRSSIYIKEFEDLKGRVIVWWLGQVRKGRKEDEKEDSSVLLVRVHLRFVWEDDRPGAMVSRLIPVASLGICKIGTV